MVYYACPICKKKVVEGDEEFDESQETIQCPYCGYHMSNPYFKANGKSRSYIG